VYIDKIATTAPKEIFFKIAAPSVFDPALTASNATSAFVVPSLNHLFALTDFKVSWSSTSTVTGVLDPTSTVAQFAAVNDLLAAKASSTALTSGLALKADITTVDTALTLKANSSDMYTKFATDAKFALLSTSLTESTAIISVVFGYSDFTGNTAIVSCFLSKIGSQVQLSIPSFQVNAGTAIRSEIPTTAAPLSATYRPAVNCVAGMCVVTTNLVKTTGFLWITAGGNMFLYRDATSTPWPSGSTNFGLHNRTSCFSWSTAAI